MRAVVARARAVGALLNLVCRANPARAALALSPVIPLAGGLSFLAARNLLRALPNDDRGAVARAALLFTAAFVGSAWLGRVVRTTRIQLGELTMARFHLRRIEAVLAPIEVSHLERSDYLDRLEILRSRAFDINQSPRMLGWLVDSGGGIAVSVALLFSVRPVLTLVVLGGVPAAWFNARAQRQVETAREVQAVGARRAVHLYDIATRDTFAKEVRVCDLAEELLQRYAREWRASDGALLGAELRAGAVQAVGWLVQAAAFALGVVALVQGVRDRAVSAPDVFLALGAMGLVVGQFTQAAGGLSSIGRIERLFDHLAAIESESGTRLPPPHAETAVRAAPSRIEHGIALEGVRFRYPGASRDALSDVSVVLPAGSVCALVGDNGAGKSTFVKLLFGLYRPTGGRILVDDLDLAGSDVDDWRRRTSACFQDHLRLELIARESVGAGDLGNIDDEELVTAAVGRAAANDVVAGLPEGLASQLGSRFGGQDISGGQWQKLAIARAMMRTSPLLLAFDEPAAALDALAEREIFRSYASASREAATTTGAITLLVSHRFSTVRMADVIVVLDAGRVLEVGSHAELMAARGTYAELYELQARYYE